MSEYVINKLKWRNEIHTEYLNKNNKNVDYITLLDPRTEV